MENASLSRSNKMSRPVSQDTTHRIFESKLAFIFCLNLIYFNFKRMFGYLGSTREESKLSKLGHDFLEFSKYEILPLLSKNPHIEKTTCHIQCVRTQHIEIPIMSFYLCFLLKSILEHLDSTENQNPARQGPILSKIPSIEYCFCFQNFPFLRIRVKIDVTEYQLR